MVADVIGAWTWLVTERGGIPSPLALAGAVLIGLAFLPILRGLMLMLAWPLMMSGAL